MLWLCVYLPLLPLQVFKFAGYHCSDKNHGENHDAKDAKTVTPPFAVTEKQRILLCNESARQSGIEPGISLGTALALNHQLLNRNRDTTLEQSTLQQLAESLYRFTPQVSLRMDNRLLLEIGGSLQLFNGLARLEQQLADELDYDGFRHSRGIANTPMAAELFALYHWHFRKPADQLKLQDIPVELMVVPQKLIRQCQDLGIQTLGELLALPAATLGKRFEQSFIRYLQKVTGEWPDPQKAIGLPNSFRHHLHYIDGLHRHSDLLPAIEQLLQKLCSYLQLHQLQCLSLEWQFRRFSKKNDSLHVSLSRPQHEYTVFSSLTQLQLQEIPLDSPVESITLVAGKLVQQQQQNTELFSDNNKRGDASVLFDKLTTRLGKQALQQPLDSKHFLPELTIGHMLNHHDHHLPATQPQQGQPGTTPPRPLWLLPQPEQLLLRHNVLYWHGRSLFILHGPERIESHWWESPASRDYFIAATACQNRSNEDSSNESSFFWIYHNRHNKQWYLQGIFS